MASNLQAGDPSYTSSVEQWRAAREAKLKADDGWLTVAGLFWLKEGVNVAGTAPSSDIVLPSGPAHLGDFVFHNGATTFRNASGASTVLRPDSEKGGPDKITAGNLTMFVIHRGDRFAIRLKDKDSPQRREFTGLHWFPVNEAYKVHARFVPYESGRTIAIPNILGQTEQEPSPGYVEFTLNNGSYRLDPVLEDGRLFFIFRDQTAGKETYGAGRFLYAEMPKDGTVLLDFNKAENPPCAFTAFATCPLPPPQNRLAVRIEAGELNYGHHH